MGCESGASWRHGGIEHQYWKEKLAARLKELGFRVETEHPVGGGKTIDLLARKDGRTVAFEIETGKSDVAANVKKAQTAGIDKLYVVCTSRAAFRAVEASIPARGNAEVLLADQAVKRSDW